MKMLLVGNKVQCDCCDGEPKRASHVLKFNKLGDSIFMCNVCIEEFRVVVKDFAVGHQSTESAQQSGGR